uniref:Uncharacterized protein n=1 Tax=Physcomitrium patens TaxID=3218 RepID=A0A2K1IDA4_PHYPA|nr:hypothetical protein PHYPA_029399 [Physcomitrium patens]
MYVRERSGSLRGGETEHNGLRLREREREEESSSSGGGGESDSGERVELRRRLTRGGPMHRRQPAAESPSLFTRAVGSVIHLVRVAEFEILFVSLFVFAVLLLKDLVRFLHHFNLIDRSRCDSVRVFNASSRFRVSSYRHLALLRAIVD